MIPPDCPPLGAHVHGRAAELLYTLIRRHLSDVAVRQLDPWSRAQLLSAVEGVHEAARLYLSWKDSLRADAAADGSAAVPFPSSPEESWMTTKEAAVKLSITENRVRQLIRADLLLGSKRQGRWMVDATAVDLRAAS